MVFISVDQWDNLSEQFEPMTSLLITAKRRISASKMCLLLRMNSSRPFEKLYQIKVTHVHGFRLCC